MVNILPHHVKSSNDEYHKQCYVQENKILISKMILSHFT